MAAALEPPEFFDGGYWYVLPTISDANGIRPDYAGSFCAQYGTVNGTIYAVIRRPDPDEGIGVVAAISDVIESAHSAGSIPAAEKPFMRIGAR